MHIYEYLFTAVVIILILLAASTMITTLSDPARSTSEKEQLKVTAEKIMTQMLLDPGYPYNWGNVNTDPTTIKTFGLAKYGGTSREAYMLDPDKVLRINPKLENLSDNVYVNAGIASSLLNLGYNYGFTLEFNETLNINMQKVGNTEKYMISVTTNYGQMPILNARVTGALYYIESSAILKKGPVSNTTIYDGNCTIDFNFATQTQMKALIVVVDYYGAHIAKTFQIGTSITTAYILGKQILSSESYNIQGTALEVIVTKENENYTIKDFTVENDEKPNEFIMKYPPETSVAAVLASQAGPDMLVVASRDFSISYRTIPSIRSSSFAFSLERTVLIGCSTYTATLYIWRMSW